MARLYIEKERITKAIPLRNREVRYLVRVLRLQEGDELEVFNGLGGRYKARLIEEGRGWYLEILEELEAEEGSEMKIVLGQGLLKGEKMKWVIQKATELGVSEIVPVVTERSVPVYEEESLDLKLSRWQRIAEEASRQSNRAHVPFIGKPITLPEFVQTSKDFKIALWEKAVKPLGEVLPQGIIKGITVLIGPEGGLTEREAVVLEEGGFTLCTLGRHILRAETASLAVVSILQHLLGDLGR